MKPDFQVPFLDGAWGRLYKFDIHSNCIEPIGMPNCNNSIWWNHYWGNVVFSFRSNRSGALVNMAAKTFETHNLYSNISVKEVKKMSKRYRDPRK